MFETDILSSADARKQMGGDFKSQAASAAASTHDLFIQDNSTWPSGTGISLGNEVPRENVAITPTTTTYNPGVAGTLLPTNTVPNGSFVVASYSW